MPSEQEVIENGMNLKQINTLLVEKVEELTLHSIELNKKNEQLTSENKLLKNKMQEILQRLEGLENKF